MHTQHLVNRVVEATSPDCIEFLTEHVFQSIFEVDTVAASIVLGQRENNDVQKAVTLCTSTGRHNLANCNPAKIANVLRLQQLGKYFAKLVGPFSLHLANHETRIVVELQLIEAWKGPSARRQDAPNVAGLLATHAPRRAWQHRWVEWTRCWQLATLIESSYYRKQIHHRVMSTERLATADTTDNQL